MRKTGQRLTPKKSSKASFLEAFAQTCSISRAADLSGISRQTHYNRLAADAQYKTAFAAVQEQAAQVLEDEAVRRAYEGTEKAVTVAGKREVIREYSDTLLIFLLKSLRPEKYRERWLTGPDGQPAGLSFQLVVMDAGQSLDAEPLRTVPISKASFHVEVRDAGEAERS